MRQRQSICDLYSVNVDEEKRALALYVQRVMITPSFRFRPPTLMRFVITLLLNLEQLVLSQLPRARNLYSGST